MEYDLKAYRLLYVIVVDAQFIYNDFLTLKISTNVNVTGLFLLTL